MTEFDSTGFSAVADFFGRVVTDEKRQSSTSDGGPHRKHPIPSSASRQGVGTRLVNTKTLVSEDATSRIMKLGKRRRQEEEEGEENIVQSQSNVDDEEDQGRTAITEKPKVVDKHSEVEVVQKNEKKKLEKKERQIACMEEDIPENKGEVETGGEELPSQQEETVQTGKKKRRKVRSKQKNIYKDKRAHYERPEHLRVGNASYGGRPITPETRVKLNLPPSKSSMLRKSLTEETIVTTVKVDNEVGVTLAVDDLLNVDQREGEAVPNEPEKHVKRAKKDKKRKKSRYKNLAI
jgi:hypothetical protein